MIFLNREINVNWMGKQFTELWMISNHGMISGVIIQGYMTNIHKFIILQM